MSVNREIKVSNKPYMQLARVSEAARARLNPGFEEAWIGDVSEFDEGADAQIYSGTRWSGNGAWRVIYNKKDHTFIQLGAKSPDILQGKYDENGRVALSEAGLEGSYVLSAYRSPLARHAVQQPPALMMKAMMKTGTAFFDTMDNQSLKHTTWTSAIIDNKYATTNQRFNHEMVPQKNGNFNVNYYAPARRQGGSFMTVPVTSGIRGGMVRRSLGKDLPFNVAFDLVAKNCGELSSKFAAGRRDVYGTRWMATQAALSKVINLPRDRSHDFQTAALVGLGLGAGVLAVNGGDLTEALSYGLGSSYAHMAYDEAARESLSSLRRAFNSKSIERYEYMEDMADYYKYESAERMAYVFHRANLNKLDVRGAEFLPLDRLSLGNAELRMQHGMNPKHVRGMVTTLPSRAIASMEGFADAHTAVNNYPDVTVVRADKADGKRVKFVRLRDNTKTFNHAPMQDYFRQQLTGGILRIERSPQETQFSKAFESVSMVGIDQMMSEMEPHLFDRQRDVSSSLARDSLSKLEGHMMVPVQQYGQETEMFMQACPEKPFYLDAMRGDPKLDFSF